MKIQIFLICFLFSGILARAQNFEWGAHLVGTTNDYGWDVVTDDSGNTYITGSFQGILDADPGSGVFNLVCSSGTSLFITKLDTNGQFVWAKSIDDATGRAITFDPSGYIYVVGHFEFNSDFDPDAGTFFISSLGGKDGFLLKLDLDGNFVWVKAFGGSDQSFCSNVLIDSHSNIIITGEFKNNVDFDPSSSTYSVTSTCPEYDIFMVKLTSTGDFLWVRNIASNLTSEQESFIHNDTLGNIYLSGNFKNTVDFDPGSGTYSIYSANDNSFISKFDSSGIFIWVKQLIESGYCYIHGATVTNEGNIYVTGEFTGVSDFDLSTGLINRISVGLKDIFVAKYKNDGILDWVESFGSTLNDFGITIKASNTNAGGVVMSGQFYDSIDFNPGIGVNSLIAADGYIDAFVLKLDSGGNYVWVEEITGDHEEIMEVHLDNDQNIYLTGQFQLQIDVDPGLDSFMLNSPTVKNIFITKWNSNCSNFYIIIDSLKNIQCLSPGFSNAFTVSGLPPITYMWSTSPVTTDSIVDFVAPGIYNLVVTDLNGCTNATSIIVNGPYFGSQYDLNSNLLAGNFRPGMEDIIFIDAYNNNCDTISGNLTLILDSIVSYVSAVPTPDVISGDTLIWNFTALNYDSTHLAPVVNVIPDASATIGDTVCFQVMINPIAGDADSTNNYKTYCYPVVNSYDPNDKQVYPQGECPQHFVLNNQKLTYTVRFQNTGTAEAINIYILDSLDVNLNLNSVRLVGNSHYVITEVLPGNVLKFRFDNIHLADSTSDEANSHGYVIFEVDPLPALLNGTIIENTSHIYFDFNPPITTNTVFNTLMDVIPSCFLSVSDAEEVKEKLMVYPNPANQTITILTQEKPNQVIVISDVYGRIVKQITSHTSATTINVQEWPNGVYILSVNGKTAKLVKN